MKLQDIGFYTLSDTRAKLVSSTSPLYRCELVLTDRCNFACSYCRGLRDDCKKDMPLDKALDIITYWGSQSLKNIRFSGGEPSLYEGLDKLIIRSKQLGINRIAISTNGSASFDYYRNLLEIGVNDFSISLDACCSSYGDLMAGNILGSWQQVVENIKKLSPLTYVTVGIVLNEENIKDAQNIIEFAHNLGVSDIRVIPSSHYQQGFTALQGTDSSIMEKHPILKYRVDNYKQGKDIRGLSPTDSNRCPLVLDDMAISGNYHFPCIIYMREHGEPIGNLNDFNKIREDRKSWAENHDTQKDPICKKNCLDVCRHHNNKVLDYARQNVSR